MIDAFSEERRDIYAPVIARGSTHEKGQSKVDKCEFKKNGTDVLVCRVRIDSQKKVK